MGIRDCDVWEIRAAAVPRRGSGNLERELSPTGGSTSSTHGPLAGLVSEDDAILAYLDLASFCSVSATLRYQVRQAHGQRELEAALALRHEVFCVEQGVPGTRSSTAATATGFTWSRSRSR